MRRQMFAMLAILLALGTPPARGLRYTSAPTEKLLSLDPGQKAKFEALGR